ncbi:DUF2339 domain-containing protein [Sulfitobacter sp. F26169L]|uniref:DUF2339 domain-containing protein n=1 Tax=Sulfitobacter sp. F26169L TaxID=2996015 RepID=UPI002260DB79|nr:DUF2339 domain-containing protein [Sulfitobacter sp. F26169L]MCX7567554.1 DUF2339 domain-containing protein [Sulfitobacter sp. F26169L]
MAARLGYQNAKTETGYEQMEALLVFLALVVLAIPVTLVVLVIGQSGLRRRLEDAEREIKALRRGSVAAQTNVTPSTASQPVAPKPPAADPELAPAIPRDSGPTPEPRAQARTAPPPIVEASSPPPRAPSPIAQALSNLGPWLQQNWFYAVSAASLALAGIFLVQYGMENGLLPPRARVAAALAFGAALIGVGEFIRRRFGDDAGSATAYLPSVFSGAGIVTLFGAILSARMLYDLIGGGAAMGGMVIVALIAIVLGWMHGPLLVAVGVIGAYGAPVVLGNSNSDPSPLFGYFAVVAVLGLGVDTIRRWGWISALTLFLAYLMGLAIVLDGRGATAWTGQLYFATLALLAILIPARSFSPDHAGPPAMLGVLGRMTIGAKARGVHWPSFPTLMAFSSVAASCVILLILWKPGEAEIWLSVGLLTVLSVVLIGWSGRAPALQDAALLPALTLLLSIFAQAENRRISYTRFTQTYSENVEAVFPWVITILVGIGVAISFVAIWRSLRGGQFGVIWAVVAAVYAPAMAIVLEASWHPAKVIGPYPWALHAAALAVLMALFAERFARHDGAARLRVSFAVMSALSCMAFAFVIVLSSVALTVALAVTVVAAAALDRQWSLPPLGWFIAVGVVTLGYRLVVDPGLQYGAEGPLGGVLLAYGGTLVAFVAALWLLRPLARRTAQVMLDSAAWSTAGLLVSLLLLRWIESAVGRSYVDTHWSLGLNAAIWLGLALAQVQRTEGRTSALLDKIRWGLAGVFSVIGVSALAIALSDQNPLLIGGETSFVFGPVLVNTLAAAYALPALVLLLGAWRLVRIDHRLRVVLAAAGAALLAFWGFAVIRHFWQGGDEMRLTFGISQPEQYTYTIVLLIVGAGLFYQSLARRSAVIRKAGLVVIGLAVAKVFMIDISDLDGLTRVFSLLVLGLSLAALAWLNRWAQDRDRTAEGGTTGPPDLPAQE